MALSMTDTEADKLGEPLVALCKGSKTESNPSLVEQGMEFCRALSALTNPDKALCADRAFIDSLYLA